MKLLVLFAFLTILAFCNSVDSLVPAAITTVQNIPTCQCESVVEPDRCPCCNCGDLIGCACCLLGLCEFETNVTVGETPSAKVCGKAVTKNGDGSITVSPFGVQRLREILQKERDARKKQ